MSVCAVARRLNSLSAQTDYMRAGKPSRSDLSAAAEEQTLSEGIQATRSSRWLRSYTLLWGVIIARPIRLTDAELPRVWRVFSRPRRRPSVECFHQAVEAHRSFAREKNCIVTAYMVKLPRKGSTLKPTSNVLKSLRWPASARDARHQRAVADVRALHEQ